MHKKSTLEEDYTKIEKIIKNKKILITGGSGSLGKNLTRELLKYSPKEIMIFSRNEKAQASMKKKFPECKFLPGDVKDYVGLRNAIRGVNIVIHAAAFKFLWQAEIWVRETILTNVFGTMNLIDAVLDEKNVEICLGISTDKVTNCRNVYGYTKGLLEKLFIQAHNNKEYLKTKFIVCRYGNVSRTDGSVIPLFEEMVKNKQDLTITSKDMTRFCFKMEEAIKLIMWALENGNSGEIVMQEMPAYSLLDLAEVIADKKVGIKEIGSRPGEKLHEELVGDYESKDTIKTGNKLILRPSSNVNKNQFNLTSDKAYRLSKEEIEQMLKETKEYMVLD